MIKTGKRMRLCICLLCLNLLFIWGNSLLPANLSSVLSTWLQNGVNLGPAGETGHGILRKLAHLTEFACLGACLTWLFGMLGESAWMALRLGALAACFDELIQLFVPGRAASVTDVAIDTAGVALGIGALLLGYTIYKKFWRK